MTGNSPEPIQIQGPVCPIPHHSTETIVIGHGSGGQMSHDLIRNTFLKKLGNRYLLQGNDAAKISFQNSKNGQYAISTDSHVVSPLFFPGGDIGRLAVSGTVNDVAMLGAEPSYLTAGFILEEGFSIHLLTQIIDSMAKTCQEADICIVAGDTKVVEKGKADGVYINTTGFGLIPPGREVGGQFAKPGDAVILSGTLGDHAIAVLQARGHLGFDSKIKSDVAPLNKMIKPLLESIPQVHTLRDPTRGGLATSLKEIACQSQVSMLIEETAIPIKPDVQMACEMLGFDPLYMANEGKVVIILPERFAVSALKILRTSEFGIHAMRIGVVLKDEPGEVHLRTTYGTTRIVDMLSGEILPRIC